MRVVGFQSHSRDTRSRRILHFNARAPLLCVFNCMLHVGCSVQHMKIARSVAINIFNKLNRNPNDD